MKQIIKILLIILLGSIFCKSDAQTHSAKFHKGDTVYNKKTKTIYVLDSLQYRNPTVRNWTTNFYIGHYPGDDKYQTYDIVESALIKPTREQWVIIRKKLEKDQSK